MHAQDSIAILENRFGCALLLSARNTHGVDGLVAEAEKRHQSHRVLCGKCRDFKACRASLSERREQSFDCV